MRLLAIGMLAIACVAPAAAADGPRVSFELAADGDLPPTAQQEWHAALTKLGISGLRIRSGGDDQIGVENQGGKDAPAYKVTGVISSDNMLHLPGGKFGIRDTAKLRKWLDKLRESGSEGVTAPPVSFGLTPSQLEEVALDLSRPVGFSTKDAAAVTAVAKIAPGLKFPLSMETGSSAALAGIKLADELQGVSSGTALAAILRQGGLVLAPRREKGVLEYRIGKPLPGRDVWPVGWPPEKRPAEAMPLLFELLNVEIAEIPVTEAIDAVAGRLEVPFVYDRRAMAAHGADPGRVQASVPSKKMSYSRVLSTVLSQAKLKYELRLDEADKPFVWITTIRPAP